MDVLTEFFQFFHQHILLAVGLLLLIGYLLGWILSKIKLPEITGFILAGLIIGPGMLGIISRDQNHELAVITEVALGIIALTIGGEFSLSKLKRTGKGVVIITLAQILLSFALVTIALTLFGMELPFALLLGSIATATAPAATVAIVQKLRARGTFVDYLFGVVALDDAGAVIVFGAVSAAVSGMIGAADHGAGMVLLEAALEILFSVGLGAAAGGLIHITTRKQSNTGEILIIALGWVFMSIALSTVFHLSPLLTNMAAGAVLINLSSRNHRIFRAIGPLTAPLYALFFVLAGTHLQPRAFLGAGTLILGLVYVLSRAAGKYFGVFGGALLARSTPSIRKYLGLSMLPQAGVAIGLIHLVNLRLSEAPGIPIGVTDLLFNIVLFSVFFNELTGPPLSQLAITRATREV